MIKRVNERRFLPFIPLIIGLVVLLVGYIVMLLWNAILPQAIHAGILTYWQATGLLVLCKILFGGFGRRFGPPRGRRGGMPGRENWINMSAEEKEKFKEEWKKRCGKGE